MPEKSALGDRMKSFEKMFTDQKLMPGLPALARLDGKAFHTWTRGLERPYDVQLTKLMVATTLYLCERTNALMGYTQSDEITLVWFPTFESPMMFDGKVSKLNSVLSSQAARYFNKNVSKYVPKKADQDADFDCRVWNVPSKVEAANAFVWRELDATRNSVSMAAQAKFSHKELQGKNSSEMQDMLWNVGINWNNYPPFFKRGTYIQRRRSLRPFTTDEIEKLPLKHAARTNPALMIERNDYTTISIPPLVKVPNRVTVIFDGELPVDESSLTTEGTIPGAMLV